ncbi:MAG: MBOAT family O-acyltransferase [Elusimicrobiota bacterium]
MLFNSLLFAVFLPAVIAIYFLLPPRRRWILLLAASYYFYMCWKVEYILLILASTLIDYFAGLKMGALKSKSARRPYLIFSLAANLGLLFAFKYLNFACASLEALFSRGNLLYDLPAFDVLLPIGISFYTFQTLSYTIEVYWGRIKPEKHLGMFALYVAFFPQLVAGPIERPEHLLPQLKKEQVFDYERLRAGLIRILWGFYKKLVIADRLAVFVDTAFGAPASASPADLLLAAYCFTFQIYCDFSAYTDIAIGSARIMGYDLTENFNRAYTARSISEFWRRWHISLSTWIRDYLFVPLYIRWAAADGAAARAAHTLILMAVFLASGLWHGANWTFAVWGAYHGLLLVLDAKIELKSLGDSFAARAFKTLFTFHLVGVGWILFRAESLRSAWLIIRKILSAPAALVRGFSFGPVWSEHDFTTVLCALAAMEAVYLLAGREDIERSIARRGVLIRWSFYLAATWAVLLLGEFTSQEFLYFRF